MCCLLLSLFISFIFQIILSSTYHFNSKNLNTLIDNWKTPPIIGFSLSFEGENYNKNDYFDFKSTSIYIKRMPKKFNFPYLKKRITKLVKKKNCGTDNIGDEIFFDKYEECPINEILVDDHCYDEEKCLNIHNGKFLNYLNNKTDSELIIEIKSINDKKGYNASNSYYDKFPNDCEYVLSIKKYMNLCNNLSISLICFLLVIVCFFNIFADEVDDEEEININREFYVNLIIWLAMIIIICSISKIYMIKKVNNIFTVLDLNYKMKNRFFNIECANLVFLLIFEIVSFIYLSSKYMLQNLLKLLSFVFASIILIPIFFSGISLMNNPFNNDSFYNDLKKNYEMSPITEIEISKISTIKKSKDSSYFNPKVPYRLGIIDRNDIKTQYLTEWKKNSFYISRMNKKYTYPKITRFKNNNNNKKCGKDSKGNYLYFPKSEACPINYIEFTNSDKPSIESYNEYNFITKKIDENTYIHYTNEYTEGEILIHLRISKKNPPVGDDDYYNELCHYLYEDDICKNDKEYLISDEEKFGYQNIDSDNNYSLDDYNIKNKKIYLYKRTYIGVYPYTNIGNEILYIKSFIIINQIFIIISYTFTIIIFICNFLGMNNIIINILCIILDLICIILNYITIKKYNKVKGVLDDIDLDIKQYSNKPIFVKLDIGVFVIFILILLFFIILLAIFLYQNKIENPLKECDIKIDKYDLFNLNDINYNLLFLLFIIIVPFFALLLTIRLYNEGYIETIINNWKKTPIMNITLGFENEKIGYFKNFKNKKSQDIYKWQGISFNFIRKSNKYIYSNIIKNNYEINLKQCGKDNEGNILYFYKDDDCPINYVKITSSKETPDEISHLKPYVYNLKLNDDNYLHFTNKYIDGKILIDFKISNFNGPCLNKNINNEICSFFLKKCDLEEKEYICNAYKTINAYDKINNYSFQQFISDNSLNYNGELYDTESKIYLYSETYIGFNKIDNKVIKYIPQIFTIYKLTNGINIISFIIFFLLMFDVMFLHIDDNESIIINISLSLVIFSFLIIILFMVSFIKYFVISNNLFKKFGNEISDYYSKIRWQVILIIFMFVLFILSLIFIVKIILRKIEFNTIKLYFKKVFEIIFQKKNIKYFTIIFNIIIIILLLITLIIKEYNDTSLNNLKKNWNKNPILSFSIVDGESWELGKFKNSIINNWKSSILKIKRMENQKYTDFLIHNFDEDDENLKICGKDYNGKNLKVLKNKECPINYIQITNDLNNISLPDNLDKFQNISLGNYYIVYSNHYSDGRILIDFKISDFIIPSINPKLNNQICKYVDKKCNLNSEKLNYDIIENEFFVFENVDSISLSTLLNDNNIKPNNYDTDFYLYTETYITCKNYPPDYSFFFKIKRFSTNKNLVLFFFTLFFLLIPVADLGLIEIKLGILGIIIYIILNIMILINFILCCVSVSKYNHLVNNLLKSCNNSIGESFKSRKWYYKINICLIIFYLIDLVIGIYFYFPLKEKKIISINENEDLIKELEELKKEEERLNNEIIKENKENIEIKTKLDKELDELEKKIISNNMKIRMRNEDKTEINSIINELEIDLYEKQNELKNLKDEIMNINSEKNKRQLNQELNVLKNTNEKLECEMESLKLINKDFNKDYTEILDIRKSHNV